jgi:hypothetical protein
MEKRSQIHIKGTGQLNGPVIINDKVEMETSMANRFMGANRYEVIQGYLNANHPGVKVDPKKFGISVIHLGSVTEKSSSEKSSSSSKSSSGSGKSFFSKAGSAVVGTASAIGAVGGYLLSSDGDDNEKEEKEEKKEEVFNFNIEKEKFDFKGYREQKKDEERERIREEMNNGGNKFIGYLRILGTYRNDAIVEETEGFDFNIEKEKLNLEYYKKHKKEEERKKIREEMKNGGNKFIGCLKILLTYKKD